MCPPSWPAEPRDGVDELGLPVAVDPGDPDDLAGVDRQRDRRDLLDASLVPHAHVFQTEERLARLPLGLSTAMTSRPTIRRAKLMLGRAGGRERLDELARDAAR